MKNNQAKIEENFFNLLQENFALKRSYKEKLIYIR
jgi:hypothetical protein